MQITDYLGIPIKPGDAVCFSCGTDLGQNIGLVVKLTPKGARICFLSCWSTINYILEDKFASPSQMVKIDSSLPRVSNEINKIIEKQIEKKLV